MLSECTISKSEVTVYVVPTDAPEADGTAAWDSSTMVLVRLEAGGKTGMGYTYADAATGKVAKKLLEKVVEGRDAFEHAAILQAMFSEVRNSGEVGICAMAIAAIDNAIWDLRARVLDIPLVKLLGAVRKSIPVYGSGGFTSYDDGQLIRQLGGWADQGFGMVKMKVGTHPESDRRRVEVARRAIGETTKLFVDANGAYTVTQAIELAHRFAECGVRWFEEPVSSDDLAGLRQLRARAPLGMDIAAGEYGYTAWYFSQMLREEAVTVLQADATRCGGISGFLDVAALCWAENMPLSSHCGPSVHLHVCCAVPRAIHMEFFHDHVRIERMFFDGFCEPKNGMMTPDMTRPGIGLELKAADANEFLQ